jgi:peptide deformylase
MAKKIVKYPDSILRQTAIPIDKISKDIFTFVDEMIETMLKEDGIGLAANQVGSRMRLFVLNIEPHDAEPHPAVFINPEIINTAGHVIDEEGCLSLPELYLNIPRAQSVRLRAKNLYNEDLVYEMSGLLARAAQHEIDHLNGVVIIDHVLPEEEGKVKDYLEKLTSCANKP